jgi:collagenase-like PrtC family protease
MRDAETRLEQRARHLRTKVRRLRARRQERVEKEQIVEQKRIDDIANTLDDISTTLDEIKEEGRQLSPEEYAKTRQALDRAIDAIDCLDNSRPPEPAK